MISLHSQCFTLCFSLIRNLEDRLWIPRWNENFWIYSQSYSLAWKSNLLLSITGSL